VNGSVCCNGGYTEEISGGVVGRSTSRSSGCSGCGSCEGDSSVGESTLCCKWGSSGSGNVSCDAECTEGMSGRGASGSPSV